MENEQIGEIVLKKARSDGIVISRVPKPTRDEFIEFANQEFAGDYGLLLKTLWDNYKLWTLFMQNWDIKLNYIIDKLENKSNNQQITKTMLSGKKILKGGIEKK